jgi:alkaline phosphatase D
LGESQLQWIKDALLFSRNTFKIVAIGSQFLSTAKVFENYSNYEEERAELIRFIQENQIKNVIFITGDRHHSELSILPAENKPSIYDFTCSPLSSGSNNNAQKEINELRIPASLLTGNRNFGVIKFSGEYKSRSFEFQLYSKTGELLWNQKFMKQ